MLTGTIEYLLSDARPRTIVLTHFQSASSFDSGCGRANGSELFANQFLDDELPITHCHMKTELVEDSKDLVYLYRSAIMASNA